MGTQWIEANGARFRYEHRRRDVGTLVLVHEMGGRLESFDGIVADLGERWSVLRYDQRGAGQSDRIAGSLSLDTPAADLAGILDRLEIAGPVVVVGAALGASVAIRFAAKWPARVAALALLAPSTGLIPGNYAATIEKIELLEKSAREGTPAQASNGAPLPDPASSAATWRMLIGLDLAADLAGLPCPTLVAAGSRDSFRPPAHVAEIAARIPKAQSLVLDTGHVMAIETPHLVAATIATFLNGIGFVPGSSGSAGVSASSGLASG
ncbi:MAG: alpha/beta fold hydrolase [Aquamicrobium sp.]|uniref:alpha/beta fold hydrolase n=1 Tax=Mesorhizobium sp. Pch-S TaxID=2082387 RepID=UPI0010113E3B|nr:alpha/beta hydrolase [Mesorhizobium sp. Pch-S]MBR2687359.1 alpha/beta fold hydrolase [Aquamicrobium sp.]QAZ45071.1 alpha/beta hydrolase [Mesorhizobium sp. Pch-S]